MISSAHHITDWEEKWVYIERGRPDMQRLLYFLKGYHERCHDFHPEAEELSFVAVQNSAPVSHMYQRFALQIDKDGKGGKQIHFTNCSWKQFCKKINLPSAFTEILDGNPDLLARNINYLLRQKEQKYLLRAVEGGKENKLFLRGLLSDSYIRLDNYMIAQALDVGADKLVANELELGNVHWAGEELQLQYVNKLKKTRLTRKGDECLSGVSVIHSDVGARRGVIIRLYYERLVCTNGMTTKSTKDFLLFKKKLDFPNELYHNKMPPWQLPEYILNEIRKDLLTGILQCYGKAEDEVKKLVKELSALAERRLSLSDDTDSKEMSESEIKSILSAIIRISGIRNLLGVSIDDIYKAYLEEIRDFEGSKNTAYAFYNAITRYASRRLTSSEWQQSYSWQERLELSHRITLQAARISQPKFDWVKVKREAKKEVPQWEGKVPEVPGV